MGTMEKFSIIRVTLEIHVLLGLSFRTGMCLVKTEHQSDWLHNLQTVIFGAFYNSSLFTQIRKTWTQQQNGCHRIPS